MGYEMSMVTFDNIDNIDIINDFIKNNYLEQLSLISKINKDEIKNHNKSFIITLSELNRSNKILLGVVTAEFSGNNYTIISFVLKSDINDKAKIIRRLLHELYEIEEIITHSFDQLKLLEKNFNEYTPLLIKEFDKINDLYVMSKYFFVTE